MMRLSMTIALLASCGSSESVAHATLGDLAFSIPTGWQSRELSDHTTKAVEWTPIVNDNKESIVVLKSSRRGASVRGGTAHAEHLLGELQAGLPNAAFGTPIKLESKHFVGVRVEGSFVPPGQVEHYQRVHAVLLEPHTSSFINVIYTARVFDREAFELVIDSLRRGAQS